MNIKKLLIVDDNAGLGKLYSMIMKQKGWQVTHVETAALAEDFIRENDFCTFVLLDYRLNGSASDDLAKKIREAYPDARIILFSADSPYAEAIRTLLERNIVNHFLEKPCSIDNIIALFENMPIA